MKLNRWTLEEEKYLLDNWDQENIDIIMKKLNRTKDSIIRKAQRLGINTSKTSGDRIKKKWSEEEEKILYEYYNVKSTKEIAKLLPGRTRKSIIKKAKQLGLNSINVHWSEEEIIYLEEKWGIIPVENIAKKLGRTKNGVLLKANKIGLREQVIANGEYLTPKNVASILAVSTKTVYNWMERGYLRYKRLKVNTIKKYQITVCYFKAFLENYQDKWDTRTADMKLINACFITSKEKNCTQIPDWLKRKIEMDKQRKGITSRRKWTVKEEIALKSMIQRGKSYKEIAYLLNRSLYSIQGKMTGTMSEFL